MNNGPMLFQKYQKNCYYRDYNIFRNLYKNIEPFQGTAGHQKLGYISLVKYSGDIDVESGPQV